MDSVFDFADGYRKALQAYQEAHQDSNASTSFELGAYLKAYMVREELGVELRQAVKDDDVQGTLDALIDSIYFCLCGLYQKFSRDQVNDAWEAHLTRVATNAERDWTFTGDMFADMRNLKMSYMRFVDPDVLVDGCLSKLPLNTLESAIEGLYFVVLELDRMELAPDLVSKAFDLVHQNNMTKLTTGSIQERDGALKLVKPKTHVSADEDMKKLLEDNGRL